VFQLGSEDGYKFGEEFGEKLKGKTSQRYVKDISL